jgi:hypothetical protein
MASNMSEVLSVKSMYADYINGHTIFLKNTCGVLRYR